MSISLGGNSPLQRFVRDPVEYLKKSTWIQGKIALILQDVNKLWSKWSLPDSFSGRVKLLPSKQKSQIGPLVLEIFLSQFGPERHYHFIERIKPTGSICDNLELLNEAFNLLSDEDRKDPEIMKAMVALFYPDELSCPDPQLVLNALKDLMINLSKSLKGQHLFVKTLSALSRVRPENSGDFVEYLKIKTDKKDRELLIGLAPILQEKSGLLRRFWREIF